jgi:hypothetical protein
VNLFEGPSYVSILKTTSLYTVSKEISKDGSCPPLVSQLEKIICLLGVGVVLKNLNLQIQVETIKFKYETLQ